jgi:flavin reductase (DIM6/NTAB) family NADH-FMN oxidoreductase RutF
VTVYAPLEGEDLATCQANLKALLSHTGQQVCVITGQNARGLCGATVSSFHSCSMEPPMVFFNIGCHSTMDHLLLADGDLLSGTPFIAHVLTEQGESLARAFAKGHGAEKFDGVKWHCSGEPFRQPVLECSPTDPQAPRGKDEHQVLGWMECMVEHALSAGKNWVVIASVRSVNNTLALPGGARPLLYCEGHYTSIHDSIS